MLVRVPAPKVCLDWIRHHRQHESSGVLLTTNQSLPEGEPVTVEVGWPVLLDAAAPLKLVTRDRVVWCENSHTAVRFDKWEFRARGLPMH